MSSTLLFILVLVVFAVGTLLLKPIETLMFFLDVGEFVYQLLFSKRKGDRREAVLGCLLALGRFTTVLAVTSAILWLT